MKSIVSSCRDRFLHGKHARRAAACIFTVLVAAAALIVFFSLSSVGKAQTQEYYCKEEEHIHSEEAGCYKKVLACGFDENIDDIKGNINFEGKHIHTDGCYERVLVCSIPEHRHTDECLTNADNEKNNDCRETVPAETDNKKSLKFEGDGFTSEVEYTAEAAIPDGAELLVKEYDRESETYKKRYAAAASELELKDTAADFRLFDVGIYADGEKTEPSGEVNVTFVFENAEEENVCSVIHFDKKNNEVLDFEEAFDNGNSTISFKTDSFSDFGFSMMNLDEDKYTEENFYLWIFDSSGSKIAGYSDLNKEDSGVLQDVLQYTDTDGSDYHLIPVEYFEKALEGCGYAFNENNTAYCPLRYAPSAYSPGAANSVSASYLSLSDADEDSGEESVKWYVRIQDTTGLEPHRSNIYYFPSGDNIVLNLGNGNGQYEFDDYSGGTSSTAGSQKGPKLRYTIYLNGCADSGNSVTVNLPSNSDLSGRFTVVDETGEHSAVKYDLEKEQAYNYKLVGWINIATGEYYDTSNGSTEAVVYLRDKEGNDISNVFYADWTADSYNSGFSNDSGLKETVSTGNFVSINMFDYNELFNMYSASLVQSGTDSENWTDSGTMYNTPLLGTAPAARNEICPSLIFVNNKTSGYNNTGLLSWPHSMKDWNVWTGDKYMGYMTGGVVDALKVWGITDPHSAFLDMLFDPASTALGVHYVGTADNLFWIDDDGYYKYDSSVAAASYNQKEERFYVYDNPQEVTDVGGSKFTAFLPYNESDENLSDSDGTVNYWFGLNMNVNFYLPTSTDKRNNSSPINQVNGKDMVFNFSGDDDILIFIDDALVLDMSGIHDEAFGSINFTNGTVTVGMDRESVEKVSSGTAAAADLDAETTYLSLGSGSHTMTVYYMERGGSASNLEIMFNLMPVWEYVTDAVQTVTAEKIWKDVYGNILDDAYLADSSFASVDAGLFDKIDLKDITDEEDGETVYTYVYTDENLEENIYKYTVYYDKTAEFEHHIKYPDGQETNEFYSEVNDKGRIIDSKGDAVAWLSENENALYVRIDVEELNNDNNWTYTWEMLDPDAVYTVMELSQDSRYTTADTASDFKTYKYWSIIGETEIEDYIKEEKEAPLEIILTDAAQQTDKNLGSTKEAAGWGVAALKTGDEIKIVTTSLKFSENAVLEAEYIGESLHYTGHYGVTNSKEVNSMPENIKIDAEDSASGVWYIESSGYRADDSSNDEVGTFYIYTELGSRKYYLAAD